MGAMVSFLAFVNAQPAEQNEANEPYYACAITPSQTNVRCVF